MRQIHLLKKINIPLMLGIMIMVLLTVVSLYPERFATSDPYGKETLQYEKGTGKFLVPPVAPGEDYAWGTDEKGRDLRSLIIYGCRATIVMALSVAMWRLLIALPLALAAGYKNRLARGLISFFNKLFSAIPIIAIILVMTRMAVFKEFFSSPMSVATAIMAIFGWGKMATLLSKAVEDVLQQDFIEGEVAIGKTKLDIAVQNVLPHIIPTMVVLFFLEAAVVLLLLAQVGVLGMILSGEYADLNVPYEFDWATLLVYSHHLFNTFKMWLIYYPAAAFAVSIIGFNLLGEGIRMEFEKRNSRIITLIKGVPRHLSPLRLVYELKNYKLFKRSITLKLSALALAVLVMFYPAPQSRHPFDSVEAFAAVQDFGSTEFRYREYKVGRNVIAMNYISDKLKEYGIQPFDNKYIHEMVTEETPEVAKSTASFGASAYSISLAYKQDYVLAEPVAVEGSYEVVKQDARQLDNYEWLLNVGDQYKDKVLLFDVRGMEYRAFNSIINDVKNFLKPKGVIFIEDWNSLEGRGSRTNYVTGMGDIFAILMAGDKGEQLLLHKAGVLSLKTDINIIKTVHYANVMGIIPGKDEVQKDDIILIGSSLSDITDNMCKGSFEALKSGGVATQLQLAKMIGANPVRPDRTVIFAFWDESIRFNKGAKIFSDRYIDRSKNNIFYIDIGNLEGDKLIIDSSGIKPKNKKGQSYVRDLKASLKSNDIDAVFRSLRNSSIETFTSSKQEVLSFDSANQPFVIESRKKQKEATITRADLMKFHKIGQMIIDTVFDIIYDERVN